MILVYAKLEPTIQNRIPIIFVVLAVVTVFDLDVMRSNSIYFCTMGFLLSFGGESAKAASMIFDVLHGVI